MTSACTLDEQEAVGTKADKERAPKRQRIWNRCGVACAVCGKDQWWVFQGFSRCDCGQVLWVERVKDDKGNTRFPYRQGSELPAEYPGQMRTTE